MTTGRRREAIDLDELRHALAEADPSAVLVPPRILRRVIRSESGSVFRLGRSARQSSYAIPRRVLRTIVDDSELGRAPANGWPDTVLLLARPDPEELEEWSRPALLTILWRRLFRARIQAEIQLRLDSGMLDDRALNARIRSIGRAEFEEARDVLFQDRLLVPPRTNGATYRAFAAAFLDLTYFAPVLRKGMFPGIADPRAVEIVLGFDVDAEALFHATRPLNAPDPCGVSVFLEASRIAQSEEEWASVAEPADLGPHLPAPPHAGGKLTDVRGSRLARRALAAAERGNDVRAAILRTRAARLAGPHAGGQDRSAARAALKQLTTRLARAHSIEKVDAETWAEALTPLLRETSWNPESRLLYDLQKVCIDHEREVYRLDLVGWLCSFGRRPLKHSLPNQREVAIARHLRSALHRLTTVRLAHDDHARLKALLVPAVHRAERRLRDQYRPLIDAVLARHWVAPANAPERVAYHKLVEELLDRIVADGFLTLGDLRDAASRGNLKMPDLAGPREFFSGDRLLETDAALSQALDGVHRRGEIYLRALQRISSLAFGNPVGRFLTQYVALPFGGAFVLLEGLQHLFTLILEHTTGGHIHMANRWSVLLLGLVSLGVINFVRFRRHLLDVLWVLGRLVRAVVFDWPALVIRHPILWRIVSSRLVNAFWRVLVKPGLVALPVYAVASFFTGSHHESRALAGLTFVGATFVLNTRTGRNIEEIAAEGVVRAWRNVIFDLLPGLFRIVMTAFESVLEWFERLIYAVDEWLRFRRGQSRLVLALKAGLGLVWGIVAYVVRIYVNLLIEPQINPIKHFPVVTVSHKIILPMSLTLTRLMMAPLTPLLGKVIATFIAASTVFLLPGVFGFLVWELSANWLLYEANRRKELGPVALGSHGETAVRLLRPGFHSGTLPKAYARLRRAERRARWGGGEKAAHKRREVLHHVEESLRLFLERDFLGLLAQSPAFRRVGIAIGAIHMSTNRIQLEFTSRMLDRPSLWIDLEERSGLLTAHVHQTGWLTGLRGETQETFNDAVCGLYKMLGIEMVPAHDPLGTRERPGFEVEGSGRAYGAWYRFGEVTIPWSVWVALWEAHHRETNGAGPRAD